MAAHLYKFLLIRLFSSLGDQILLFIVPILVFRSTHSIAMSGLAFMIEWLPRVVSLPFAGVLSDTIGGRKVYLLADIIRAGLCIIGFLLIKLYPATLFYTISILMGICAFCYAQSFIAQEATIPSLVSRDELHKAQAAVQTIEQTSMVLGPLIASLLSCVVPIQDLLLVTASAFAISFVGMFMLKGFSIAQKITEKRCVWQNLQIGFTILTQDKRLLWLCIMAVVLNLIWGIALATGAALVTGFFARDNAAFGFLQMTSGIVSITALLIVPYFIHKTSLIFIGISAYLLTIIGGIVMGLHQSYELFVIGYLLTMSMDGIFNIYIRTERAKIIQQEHLGKTIGLIVLINQLSLPLAGLLVTQFSESIGVPNLFLLVSAAALLCLLWRYKNKIIG